MTRAYSAASPVLASVEEIIEEARNGRMFILVDDEDREKEVDLVIPAQRGTLDVVNFMAMHGRGLSCLAMSEARIAQLGLTAMSRSNRSRHETAFTVPIEARDGVGTGISAADAHAPSPSLSTHRRAANTLSPRVMSFRFAPRRRRADPCRPY